MSEWIARVYRAGPGYRVVVEGLLDFSVVDLSGIEARTAHEIVEHLRKFFPKRAPPREDPTAERVMEFEVAVAPSADARPGPL